MSPSQTIFEINASNRDQSSQVMRAKRQKDHKAIASFQQGRQGRQEGPAGPAPSCPAPEEEAPEEEKEKEAGENVEVQAPPWGPWSLGLGLGKGAAQVPATIGLSSGLRAVVGGGCNDSSPTPDTRGNQQLSHSLPVCRMRSLYCLPSLT